MSVSHSHRVVRTVCVLTVGLLILGCAVVLGRAPLAGAQVDPTSCGHFDSQADAQDALTSGEVANPEHLDPDGNGIACEERWPADPDRPPAVYDPTSCGHFDSQEDAQAAFDAGEVSDPENLDADGDGVVCENAFDRNAGTTVALPSTGSGSTSSGSPSVVWMVLLGCAAAAASGGGFVRRGATVVR